MNRVVSARERRTAVAWAVVCGLWVPPVNAQTEGSTAEDTGVSPQLWVDYNPTVPVASTVSLFGDIGLRSELESDTWWRVVVRPGGAGLSRHRCLSVRRNRQFLHVQ
jgi:hypothetical protein